MFDPIQLGWSPLLAAAFEPYQRSGRLPGRIGAEHRGALILLTADGEHAAEPSGRLRHDAAGPEELPAVGDWVAYTRPPGGGRAVVHAVLPRRSAFTRQQAGLRSAGQVVAANVDVLFLMSGLDGDLNPRRMERYLTLAWESGAEPVVVLTKADLCDDPAGAAASIEAIAFGVRVIVTSAVTGAGLDELAARCGPGRTAAALGSSGVGKSTLVNLLVGEQRLPTRETRADGRGRHTTTHRELIALPGGGCLIDTPGMRELQLWDAPDGLEATFTDVEELASGCRFRDCLHEREPGCAVRAAIAAGTLARERLESYRKLERELHYLATRHDARARREERRRWAAVNRAMRTTSY